ncbi:MAG: esterase, partial [Pseudomonadota bacterium]
GRFAVLPDHAPEHATLHLIHGKSDAVIPYAQTVMAAERLVKLGADVTADVIPFAAHEITPEMQQVMIDRLTAGAA